MKKILYILVVLTTTACNADRQNSDSFSDTIDNIADSVDQSGHKSEQNLNPSVPRNAETPGSGPTEKPSSNTPKAPKTYSNKRFKDVTVQKTGENTYQIEGMAQIFEANFGWVVEDGHMELKKGNQMTDAGAPEWGNFKFSVDVKKLRPNSHMTMILFETSAKDGSRQHELPIALR